MKKLIIAAVLFIGFCSVQAQEAKWHDDFEEASKIAKKRLFLRIKIGVF